MLFIETDIGHTLPYGKDMHGLLRASDNSSLREVPEKIILACGSGIFPGTVTRHGAVHRFAVG